MPLDPIASAVDAAVIAGPWGQSVTYQRPQGDNFDAIEPFPIRVSIDTGGEYASPAGPIYADILLQTSAIPEGPQKGDQILVSDGALQAGTYLVQEIFWDRKAGSAHLKVRWIAQ